MGLMEAIAGGLADCFHVGDFDQQPAARAQPLPDVRQHARGGSHVLQGMEERDDMAALGSQLDLERGTQVNRDA